MIGLTEIRKMIRWFISTSLCIGSSKINQRGVIAGRAYEYPTKAKLATADVNVAKAEKTGYSVYGNLCANMEYA